MNDNEWLWISVGRMSFILHCRPRTVTTHLILPVVALMFGIKFQIGGYVSLLVMLGLWRFNYLAFVDGERRICVDDYVPNIVDRVSYRIMTLFGTVLLVIFFIVQIIGDVTGDWL